VKINLNTTEENIELNENLGVNDIDKSTTSAKYILGVKGGVKEVDLSGKVPYCERHERTVAYV
jgi:hypothetical protein